LKYENFDTGLKIYFKCTDMDLREVGLVSTTLHKVINKVAKKTLNLNEQAHRKARELGISSSQFEAMHYGTIDDPFAVSLTVTNLQYGSLSVETKLRFRQGWDNLTANAAGNIIAAVILSISNYAPNGTTTENVVLPEHVKMVDIGDNLRHMTDRLAATGKPWTLVIEDTSTHCRITIKSR